MHDDELHEPHATVADTRAAILKRSKRDIVPVRRSFVQAPRSAAGNATDRSGPLAWFVRSRNLRALQSYLMVLAATSSGDGPAGWSTKHPIRVWARAFGTTEHASLSSASNAVSKTLQRLEERQLIERRRVGRARAIQVTLLREDASGEPYTRPDGKTVADRFLRLPHVFWLDGWNDKLKLPGLAMLLVALAEKPGFHLPAEKVPDWYGWSADTAERGLAELEDHGLLHKQRLRRTEPLSASGFGYVNRYFLQPPFMTAPGLTAADIAAKAEREIAALITPLDPGSPQ